MGLKRISVALFFILGFALLLGIATANAAGEMAFEVESVENDLTPGAVIRVPINVTSNPGYVMGSIDLTWNSSALQLTNVEYDAKAPNNNSAPINDPAGTYRIAFGDPTSEDIKGTGQFFTLVFMIKDSAKAGEYAIDIQGASVGIFNTDLQEVGATFTPGKISLKETATAENAVTINKPANGTAKADKSKASEGETVIITVTPDEGYEIDTFSVKDGNGNNVKATKNSDGTYSFEMPAGGAKVSVTFREANCPSKPYVDVNTDLWYHEGIDYAISKGLMKGVSSNLFEPDGSLNRAMLVTILYRLEGEPKVDGENSYTDVASGSWYDNAVTWADSKGIVKGYGNGEFGPADSITREQIAAILYRYAQFKGYSVSKKADLSAYSDASSVSDWALDAMKWANAEGLIKGRTALTLVPQGTTTRAEAAAILMRFIENSK